MDVIKLVKRLEDLEARVDRALPALDAKIDALAEELRSTGSNLEALHTASAARISREIPGQLHAAMERFKLEIRTYIRTLIPRR